MVQKVGEGRRRSERRLSRRPRRMCFGGMVWEGMLRQKWRIVWRDRSFGSIDDMSVGQHEPIVTTSQRKLLD